VLVSASGSDTQGFRALVVDTLGRGHVLTGTLTGASPVTVDVSATLGTAGLWHVLGVELLEPAAGAITVTLDRGTATDVLVASFATGEQWKGVSRRRVVNVGDVRVRLSQAQTTARYVGLYGRTETGAFSLVVALLAGTDAVNMPSEIVEVLGLCTGHVPSSKYLDWQGEAWRHDSVQGAFLALSELHAWSQSGIYYQNAAFGTLADTDATLATVAIPGTYSEVESTEVLAYADPTVTVRTVSETYASGDVMRRA
jgi:hypothetical protein